MRAEVRFRPSGFGETATELVEAPGIEPFLPTLAF
jgi:hypothetical protein